VVTEEMVDQLRPGLNRRQVRYIMGTPLIEDSFHEDRWDYRYTLRNGNETLTETQLTLWFEGDELVRVEGPTPPTGKSLNLKGQHPKRQKCPDRRPLGPL
jgi:Small protein A (tmRNA-binding)